MQKGNTLVYWTKVVSLGIILGLGLQFAQAWVAPTQAPPLGNVGGPLTTANSTQTKTGGDLSLAGGGSLFIGGMVGVSGNYFSTAGNIGTNSGDIWSAAGNIRTNTGSLYTNTGNVNSINGNIYTVNGRIGAGTANPTQRLDVNGKIRMGTQTVATDAADIVATKGYVDGKVGSGSAPVGYTEKYFNLDEDTYSSTRKIRDIGYGSQASGDTCDGNNGNISWSYGAACTGGEGMSPEVVGVDNGWYQCPPDVVKTCTDIIVQKTSCSSAEAISRTVTCKQTIILVKTL